MTGDLRRLHDAVARTTAQPATQWRFAMRTRFKDLCVIPMGRLAVAAVAGGALLASNAFAQIVDPPLAAGLEQGVVWIQYRVENVRILQVFGAGRAQRISTGRPSAHTRRRPALVVGGRE
jgi:hypothetical protein